METKPIKKKNLGGRPIVYTPELADRICEQLALGKSMRTVCKEKDMPCIATVFSWFRTIDGFLKQYEKAKEESADALSEEILDIADNGTNDFMEKELAEGRITTILNPENIQRSRLRVDTRKWYMSKMKPKKYGDSMDLTTNGKDIPAPIMPIQRNVQSNNSDQENTITE